MDSERSRIAVVSRSVLLRGDRRGAGRAGAGVQAVGLAATLTTLSLAVLAAAAPAQDDGARSHRQRVLDLLDACESGSPPSVATAFGFTVAFRNAVQSGEARRWTEEQLDEIVERARPRLAEVRGDLDQEVEYLFACVLLERGRHQRAREVLEQRGRPQDGRVRAPSVVVRRLTLLADVERVLGDYAAAIQHLQQAVAAAGPTLAAPLDRPPARPDRSRLQSVLADAYGVWSEVLRENGRLASAAAMIERSQEQAQASGFPPTQANVVLREIDLLLACGRYGDALALLDRAQSQLAELAKADAAAANWQRAWIQLMRGATELRLAVHGKLPSDRAGATLGALAGDPNAPSSLVLPARMRLLELALLDGDLDRGERELAACEQHVAGAAPAERSRERARFAVLAARLARRAGCDDATLAAHDAILRQAVEREKAAWNSLPIDGQGFGFLHLSARRMAVAEALETRLELARRRGEHAAEAAAAVLLDIHACASLARAQRATCSLAGLRQHVLPPGGGILVYWPAGAETHALAIEHDQVRHWRVSAEPEILARAQELRASLIALGRPEAAPQRRRHQIAAFAAAGAALRDAVLPEDLLEAVLAWQSLTVAGTDLLGEVPFEVLPIGSGTSVRLLGETLALATVPSLAWAEDLARRPRQPAQRPYLTLLACTASPHAGGKARGTAFPRDRARFLDTITDRHVFFDSAGTLPQLAAAEPTTVLHLIAHGVVRDAELRTGLALHDGIVWHEDLARTTAAAGALCILSVCRAGSGPSQVGDGQLGTLGGALLWAGARAVVQSRDDILLHDHLYLLEQFYAGLETQAPARALQRARAALAADGDLGQRVLRAELQVIGLGHEPLRLSPPQADHGAAVSPHR